MNLCEELSRMNVASVGNSHFDKKQDMWGYSHASGITRPCAHMQLALKTEYSSYSVDRRAHYR
jgi:hypothetical protein